MLLYTGVLAGALSAVSVSFDAMKCGALFAAASFILIKLA